jgi:hypothetical protein
MKSIYLIGSLRNPEIPKLAKLLRAKGHDVFDDWFAAGPEADDYWQKYEKDRGRDYKQALDGYAVRNVFAFDRTHLNRVSTVCLVMPAGKSGHLELGYAAGLGKQTCIVFDKEPERWDAMYRFADEIYMDWESFLNEY